MPPVEQEGYWGKPTSTIDWCENNYEFSYFIAEMTNTVSNLMMILPPIWGMVEVVKQNFERKFIYCYFLLLVVGLGSWAFHMTLLYEMQLFDELPMVWGTSVLVYNLFLNSRLGRSEVQKPVKRRAISNVPLFFFLTAFCVFFTILYLYWPQPVFQHTSYGILVFASFMLEIQLIYVKGCQICKRLFIYSTSIYLFGFFLWNLDKIFCPNLNALRGSLPRILDPVTQLHGWWHVMAGYGTYLQVLFTIHSSYDFRFERLNSPVNLRPHPWGFGLSWVKKIQSCQLLNKKNSTLVIMELGEVAWLSEAAEKYKPDVADILCEMYVLQYYVDFEKKEFVGDVKIHINLLSVSPFIVLDKGRCVIEELSVRKGNDYVDVDRAYDYVPKEKLMICLSRKLIPGKYKIAATIRGQLSDKPEGFFLINHSQDRLFAMTHFCPDHAKHVFPCFNDPAFKSVFIISLVRPSGMGFKAISNMKPEKKISDYPQEKMTTIYYMATPPLQVMSLSMIIGNFVTSDPSLAKLGYTVAVSCREELINRTREVQDMICSIMGQIGKFIRTQFNLTKIDVVALPITNFPAYCMGTPGVIVFSELEVCSVSDKTSYYYTSVVRKMIHEVMHMWMGNMVTSVSWEHYWLYEGIVGYMCQLLGSQMFPSWYSDWMAIHYDLQPAMEVEPWFHAVLSNPTDRKKPPNLNSLAAQSLFYGKSTSCLRMMGSMDFTTFRFQMTQFFSHKGDITRKKLLYEFADSIVETKRMENMIFSWEDTSSYPLVSVVINGTGKVSLEQKSFGRKYSQKTDEIYTSSIAVGQSVGMIPVLYFELDDPKRINMVWFEEEGHPVLLQTVLRPFKLNWHQSGYYRVNYTKDMWTYFAKFLNEEEKGLDPEDKANLIDDAFALAEYGHIHHGVPLSLVVYLKFGGELHPLPWLTAARHLEKMYHRTFNTQISYLLEMLVKLLIESYIENESIWSVAKQPIPEVIRKLAIINLGGTFSNEDVVERLKYVLNVFLEEGSIPMELKKPTFVHALKGDDVDDELFNTVLDRFKEENNFFKKWMLWTALVAVQKEEYLANLWEIANEPEEGVDERFNQLVRLKILSTNPMTHVYFWPFIMDKWASYYTFSVQDRDNIKGILLNLIEYSRDIDFLQQLSDYGEANDDVDVQLYALKVKADCERWNAHNYMVFVEEWLHLYIMNNS